MRLPSEHDILVQKGPKSESPQGTDHFLREIMGKARYGCTVHSHLPQAARRQRQVPTS